MKVVSRYLLTSLVRGYGVMFVVVGALLWVISLLELLGGSDGSSSAIELVLRSLIAIPVDLIDLLPVVAILATATVLSTMQAQREIVVLRVSGVSLLTIVRLALVPGIMIALTALVALQFLAPVLYRAPDQAAVGELAENSLWHPWHGLWVRSENQFMNVGAFELGELPGEIAIYEFDADGKLERQIRAARAIPAVGRWMLEDVVIKRVDGGPERITEHRQWAWPSFLSERQLELFRRAPASLPLTDLWTYIQSLKMRDQDASDFELV
ncbi:MAG: LptF/LptG family permease, partial [Gammaproteobacteria bacterium]|nr:LptF/LptG family permease [Gammaproteobacteria bacterium]